MACKVVQASDMAAEYAAKLAVLHEESAARADTDRRKRRERYIMLADLQAQAQVCPQRMCFIYNKLCTACWGTVTALRCIESVKHSSTLSQAKTLMCKLCCANLSACI